MLVSIFQLSVPDISMSDVAADKKDKKTIGVDVIRDINTDALLKPFYSEHISLSWE